MARATDAGKSEGQGVLMIAEMSNAPAKWTTVGVAKALIVLSVVRRRMPATSVITTNWTPMSAAPDDPTIT
jgi:hypothetical protein